MGASQSKYEGALFLIKELFKLFLCLGRGDQETRNLKQRHGQLTFLDKFSQDQGHGHFASTGSAIDPTKSYTENKSQFS